MVNEWPAWIKKDIHRLVSVDVETAGPNPYDYSLLSIGACTLLDPRKDFYIELQPTSMNSDEQAMEIHRLDLDKLSKRGEQPRQAMMQFADWLANNITSDQPPLFMGFNASFDWMFVCDYFHRFLGRNPFGHSALDLKSFYMGNRCVGWKQTSMSKIKITELRHNALDDAHDQAQLFKEIIFGIV